ncbi:Hypothetical protein, putative [Bodo saltans]|uniref:Membrane-associated protein n=1 Tax=Bodo saltans TaxID=75058 RepID=A0A0S4J304_BODSA|nr:Hypothetical protein, putative [Bodo saltans]|eukprot:CUG26656.1 Hypothetical protein, putative [Bodo saltans]
MAFSLTSVLLIRLFLGYFCLGSKHLQQMPSRPVASTDSDDLDATAKSTALGDTASSLHPPTASPKRRVIPHDYADAMVSRLAQPIGRPEYLQTPGPYTIRYNPHNRKIPFVFPAMERFPPPPPVPSDSLDCNRAQCEPRSRDIVFTKEERFLLPPSATKDVPVYDVESGVRLCEDRSYSTLLPPHGDANQRPSRRVAVVEEPPPQSPLTQGFNTSMIIGGRISKSGTRDVNDFLVRRSASPGPVYSPTYTAVESASFAARFSTQSRMPPISSTDGSTADRSHGSASERGSRAAAGSTSPSKCRCLGEYPDCDNGVRNFSVLSTWENAPVAAMGKPVIPYTNPNKQQAPPPPEDDTAPMRRSRGRPSSAARVLRGSVVIQNSEGEAVQEEPTNRGEGGGSPDEDGLYVWPRGGAESNTAAAASAAPTRSNKEHVVRPSSAPLVLRVKSSTMMSRTSPLEKPTDTTTTAAPWQSPTYVARALESPFHASRVESPAPVHVTTLTLQPSHQSSSSVAIVHPCTTTTARSTSGKRGAKERWIKDAARYANSVSRRPQSATCPHPWMATNDYMQVDVAAKVTSDVVALCGNPRRVKFGAGGAQPAKRQVGGGWGWASSWQRGAKAPLSS